MLVLILDFKEVGEHARRRVPLLLHRAGLEEPLDRRSRVTVLCDQRFERTFLAECGCKLRTKSIETLFAFGFGSTLFIDRASRLLDLGLQASQAFTDRLELHAELTTTS